MKIEERVLYLELGRPVGAQLACEHLLELLARHNVGGGAHAVQNARELRRHEGLILCEVHFEHATGNRERKGYCVYVRVCVSMIESEVKRVREINKTKYFIEVNDVI